MKTVERAKNLICAVSVLKTLSTALFLFISLSLSSAQAPPPLWVQEAAGTQGYNGNSVALDSLGNIYVAGSTQGGTRSCPTCGGLGFLAKYNAAGSLLWETNLGGTANGFLNALCVRTDGAGNAYVAGTFNGKQTLGSLQVISINGGDSGFVAKVNSTGQFLWAQVQGESSQNYGGGNAIANAIAVDAAGNCCVVGNFNGWATFGGTNFSGISLNASGNDMFVAEYAANGTFLWVQQASSSTEANGVALDASDDVFVTGYFNGTAYWGNPFFIQTNLTVVGNQDLFLAEYDSSGNLMWVSSFGITNFTCQGNAVAIAGNGNAFVAGQVSGTYAGGFLGEYAPSGNALWTTTVTNAPVEGVFVDSSNFVYATGQLNGTANFGGTNIASSNDGIFLTKYNNTGNAQWVTTFDGNLGYGEGQDVAVTSLGEIYLTGYFTDSVFGDGTLEMFLLKLGFNVSVPGPILAVQMYPGITIDGLAGQLYQIQAANSLQPTNWQTLTNIVLPFSPYVWVDTSPNPSTRFYRVALVQP